MLRWIIGPIIKVGGANRPLVATALDPGRTYIPFDDDGNPLPQAFKEITHTSICNSARTRALSFCGGADLSQISAVSDLFDLFDGDYDESEHPDFLTKSPIDLGWPGGKRARVRRRFSDNGAVLKDSDPLHVALNNLARQFEPMFDAMKSRPSVWITP